MSQSGDPWNAPSFWEWLIGIVVGVIGFCGGLTVKALGASYSLGTKAGEMEMLDMRLKIIEAARATETRQIDEIAEKVRSFPANAGGAYDRLDARMISLSERQARTEAHFDNISDSMDALKEKIAAVPTRAEFAEGMNQIARRLDALAVRS